MSPEPTASVPATDASLAKGRSFLDKRACLFLAIVLAASWILGLVILAAVTANPVTINQKQILVSHLIVAAKRTSLDSQSLLVVKEWISGENLESITVMNLDDAKMPIGAEYIVPLRRSTKGRFQVTPTSLPGEIPLIYPRTPEAEQQLQKILERRAR